MPSIFSRTATTPKKGKLPPTPPVSRFGSQSPEKRGASISGGKEYEVGVGEFGTIPGGISKTLPNRPVPPLTPPHSPPDHDASPPLLPPKSTFLPTHINPYTTSTNSVDSFSYHSDQVTGLRHYGFLAEIGNRSVLGLREVGHVLELISIELIRRGLTIPMLFSNQALELNQTRTKMLIQAYLDTLSSSSNIKYQAFKQDVKFAKEHELAWLLRWALSRVTRMKEGTKEICHGVLEWEVYEEWRGRERAAGYPTDAFPFLALIVPNDVYNLIITPLLHLLSRFAAHSHLSGLTPHALSSLFAPLLFDIPTSSTAMEAHTAFVQAASATEHLLLAYIRSTSPKGSLGLADLPHRLKEWVTGYPAMVPSDGELARGGPRKGARVVRCEAASRVVRAYSKDLLAAAESWVSDLPTEQKWNAWDRVIWTARRGDMSRPKFSQSYRRRMMVKENLPLLASSIGDGSRPISYGSATKPALKNGSIRSRRGRSIGTAGEESDDSDGRFSSLAGKEWSMFEEGGFDAPSLAHGKKENKEDIRNRLQFDLTESAKNSVSERRRTMDWSEFASPSGGFNRTDNVLDVSLTFAQPIEKEITDWPKERDELRRRLHKSQKDSVPFNYDTTPRLGVQAFPDSSVNGSIDEKGRVYLEEAFVDCWADLIVGCGWVDREELTFRESNWAIIEYKAKPSRIDSRMQDSDPLGDPRKTELYFLLEETVPLEYQQALLTPAQKKSTFTLFSPRNKKRNNQPPQNDTVKSRLGHGWGDDDFDRMLLHRAQTKKVTLTKSASDQPHTSVWHMSSETATPVSPVKSRHKTRSGGERQLDGPKMNETKGLFFGSAKKTMRRVKSNESTENTKPTRKERKYQKAQGVEFELHSASGVSSSEPSPKDGDPTVRNHDDKWMDILVTNGAKRMDRQNALLPQSHNKGLPVSPHPPARHPSPNPLSDQTTPPQERLSEDADAATPRGVPPERQQSIGRKAITTSDEVDLGDFEPVSPSQETFTSSNGERFSEEHGRRSSLDGPELLQPTPRRNRDTRDTIHRIVDQYNRDFIEPDLEPFEEDQGEKGYFDTDHQSTLPPVQEGIKEGRKSGDSRYEDYRSEISSLEPPEKGMIFDLTPGREPSPARYKHGEPLHFVGEEPEEEEYSQKYHR
ncbi:uncharacterized protein I206_107372 [Kwoniella pini CBS 10737]|uniref:Meiotically up-regulated protein Msb1/Mug8 domain-containing protein n=1 Tax=Kwoniella pini CBS 10737 TaxID=1296096 RepID=A0A1B9HX39_9TREE|nr:uncharacterized protein I206_05697 [Kwoniella pini CBS 10737]OCF47837.1 hypothetical protein I206_05697 [Kwoniella pini CBS 10737]